MMLEARVKTVEAIEATVCVDALASRRSVNSFSVGNDSSRSCVQSSCSYCCLFVLMQNLQTRYVTAAIANTPPITPPAIAPTSGPELDDFEELELIVDGAAEDATQTVFWHSLHVGGTREQISSEAHDGQGGASWPHPVTHRRKRVFGETGYQLARSSPNLRGENSTNMSCKTPYLRFPTSNN